MYRSRLRPTQRAALLAAHATPEGRTQLLLPFAVEGSAVYGVSASAALQILFVVEVACEQPIIGIGACVLTSDIVSAQGYAISSTADVTIPLYVAGVGKAAVIGGAVLLPTIIVRGGGACSVAGSGLFSTPFDIDAAAQAGFDGMTWGMVVLSVPTFASGIGITAVVAYGSAGLKLEAGATGGVGATGAANTIIRPAIYGHAVRGVFGYGAAALRLSPVAHGKLGNSASSEWHIPLAFNGAGIIRAVSTGVGAASITLNGHGVGSTSVRAPGYDTIFVSTRSPQVHVLEAA